MEISPETLTIVNAIEDSPVTPEDRIQRPVIKDYVYLDDERSITLGDIRRKVSEITKDYPGDVETLNLEFNRSSSFGIHVYVTSNELREETDKESRTRRVVKARFDDINAYSSQQRSISLKRVAIGREARELSRKLGEKLGNILQ